MSERARLQADTDTPGHVSLNLPPLFGLIFGSGPDSPAQLPDHEWRMIDRLAALHRLRPALLIATTRGAIAPPDDLRAVWTEAHARAARRALRVRATQFEVVRCLSGNGIEACVLKGGAIAWRGWFDPVLRPMRDVDILVREDHALAAQASLVAAGFTQSADDTSEKHLPPVRSPRGINVELHRHVLDPYGAIWRARDAALRETIWERAAPLAGGDGLLAPADSEVLLHLIVHAAIDSQFNNGPLIVFDAIALITHGSIDWARFWRTAQVIGSLRAAELTLVLVAALAPGLPITWRGPSPAAVPADLVETAAHLMLAPRAEWDWSGTTGRAIARGWRGGVAIAWRGVRRIPARLLAAPPIHHTEPAVKPAAGRTNDRFRLARWIAD